MAFDFEAARQQGNDTQIVNYLMSTNQYSNFDFDKARSQGDDTQIVDYLMTTGSPIDAPVLEEEPGMLDRIDVEGTGFEPRDVSDFTRQSVEVDPVKSAEGVARGAAAPVLGTAKVVEDIANVLGADVNIVNEAIQKNQETIKNEGLEGEAFIGELAVMLGMPSTFIKQGLGKIATVAGIEEFTAALGTGEDYLTATGRGVATTALTGAGGMVVNKVLQAIDDTSRGTKLLTERIVAGMSPEEAAAKQAEITKLIQTIPKEHQAYVLANMAKGKQGFKNIKNAIGKDTIDASRLANELGDRKQLVTTLTAGNSDVKAAQAQWTDMLNVLEETAPQKFSTTPFQDSINYLDEIYINDTGKAGRLIKSIKSDSAVGEVTVSQAVDTRKGINEMLRKSKPGSREYKELDNIKSKLDNYIDSIVTPENKTLIDDTISNYSRVINNKQFTDLIEKNTKNDFAVDWAKLVKDVKKDGLHSPEVSAAIDIAKEFEKKFRLDPKLAEAGVPGGATPDAGGVLSFISGLVTVVKDVASPVFNRDRHKNLIIQNEIIKSIRSSDNITDLVMKIRSNAELPVEVKTALVNQLDN